MKPVKIQFFLFYTNNVRFNSCIQHQILATVTLHPICETSHIEGYVRLKYFTLRALCTLSVLFSMCSRSTEDFFVTASIFSFSSSSPSLSLVSPSPSSSLSAADFRVDLNNNKKSWALAILGSSKILWGSQIPKHLKS